MKKRLFVGTRFVTRYSVYPNKEQADNIFKQFQVCTDLRNYCLDNGIHNTNIIAELKETEPSLKLVHANVLKNVVQGITNSRIGLAADKANGRKVGKLRHKDRRSLNYEGSGWALTGSKIKLSKIGGMPIILSRPIPGKIKHVVLKFTKAHQWTLSIISETDDKMPVITKPTADGRVVGIDLNLTCYSSDSDGKEVPFPGNTKKILKRLSRAQRKLSRKKKKSNNHKKQSFRVAKVYETANNRRDDFLHKWSYDYIYRGNYSGIAMEKLNIQDMLADREKTHAFRRKINDASWYRARSFMKYKAERAGIYFVVVDPAYTSQTCPSCGHRHEMPLGVQTFVCPNCHLVDDRNHVASINIKNRAFGKSVGAVSPEFKPVEIGTSTAIHISQQVLTNETGTPACKPGISCL
jgi:putative transposase